VLPFQLQRSLKMSESLSTLRQRVKSQASQPPRESADASASKPRAEPSSPEPAMISTSISDAVLSLVTFWIAETVARNHLLLPGATSVRLAMAIAFGLMAFPAFLGVFRFLFPNVKQLVLRHRFFTDAGMSIGVPLLALTYCFSAKTFQPRNIDEIIYYISAFFTLVFLLVRLGCLPVKMKAYSLFINLVALGAILLRCFVTMYSSLLIFFQEAQHLKDSTLKQSERDETHKHVLSGLQGVFAAICGMAGVAIYVFAGTVVGVSGHYHFGRFRIPKVDIFHYLITMGNLLFFLSILSSAIFGGPGEVLGPIRSLSHHFKWM